MRCRIPIVYLVDSAGVNLPYQGGVFPGQYGASRIFYYNSIMRRYLRIPQLAAVMGPCIAGGAYLPALSDVIVMVKGTSFMGLGGPNLVKGATGQTIDGETLGGAVTHTEISGVAHYARRRRRGVPREAPRARRDAARTPTPRRRRSAQPTPSRAADATTLYDLLPADHRMSYDMHAAARARSSTTASSTSSRATSRGDDLRRRAHRRHPGRRHRQPARPDQGPRGREAALRRHRLRRERGEGRVLHRPLRPRAAFRCCSCRTSPASWSAPRPSTRGSFAPARASSKRWRRRACRRSCSR